MLEVKSYPFPVMAPNSLDYPECKYGAEVSRMEDECQVSVRHHLQGDCLVADLLRRGEAEFACIVSLPATMYRRIESAPSTDLNHIQIIDYSDSGYGDEGTAVEPPMFRPLILLKNPLNHAVLSSDGLNHLWHGSTLDIPDGGIIAYSSWQRLSGHMGGLLKVQPDKSLLDGQIRVEEDAGAGYRFRIHAGGDLYRHLKEHKSGPLGYQRKSILTHALSVAFARLKERSRIEPGWWQEHVNLRIVAEKLKDAGLGCWNEDDFAPEMAATALYPHSFPDMQFEEDTEENSEEDGG
ncbi:MAG: hypothetical protein GDA55_04760 [Cellvibrionales bacterium]|nr:hypothetical protein [Cellvibrionales bacterium]